MTLTAAAPMLPRTRTDIQYGKGWRMKLSKAVAMWIEELKVTRSIATVAGYESDLNRLRASATFDSILHFTPELVRNHLLMLSSGGCKASTLHRKQVCFNQFGKWGVKRGLWSRNPVEDMARRPRPKLLPRPFSGAETAGLLALDLPPKERVLRALLFFTGLRVTPICGIKVGDVSFEPPSIRALVKGAKTQVVQMHDELRDLLYNYVLSHTNLKGQTPLLAHKNGRPFNRKFCERLTQDWGDRSNPKVPDCTPHRFRHTFATELLRSGVDVRIVKEALGHEDISSTMIYTEVTNETLKASIGRLKWTT